MTDADDALARIAALASLPAGSPALEQALTHPSLANERKGVLHNQRLEFLGDAVLGFCASEELYGGFPDADEGMLTRLRAQLVNAEALAAWGRHVGLAGVLRVGRGGGALRESTNALADAVEALIAAAYLEAGLDAARRLSAVIVRHGMELAGPLALRDAKSELQERLQALGKSAPHYELVETSGPSHEPRFRVRVSGGGVVLAEGDGRSKRVAEQAAAAVALEHLPSKSEPPPSGRAERR
ncbi:MAG TPA: ribonuclease III [Polyangiaceae bacterium]|nr:ribonuclease III [Polyangiaceae bacterium]